MNSKIKIVEIEEPAPPKPPVYVCPKHGSGVPAMSVSPTVTDTFDISGHWCVVCMLENFKAQGCNRCEQVVS